MGQGIGPGAAAAARPQNGATGVGTARSPPPGFAQVRASQRPFADARARRRRRPLDRLHREILVSRNNVAQIFTRSFNDVGRTDDVRRHS